jgi:hypothetical protein
LREHVNDIIDMDDDELIARAEYVLSRILSVSIASTNDANCLEKLLH